MLDSVSIGKSVYADGRRGAGLFVSRVRFLANFAWQARTEEKGDVPPPARTLKAGGDGYRLTNAIVGRERRKKALFSEFKFHYGCLNWQSLIRNPKKDGPRPNLRLGPEEVRYL